ncbi:hypothetical protein Tco_0096428, partial [Tanacetum coccineum]
IAMVAGFTKGECPQCGFPGDMSPGITRAEKLEWDSFPGDLPGRQSRAHVVSVNGLSATMEAFPGRHVARESGVKRMSRDAMVVH